MSQGKMDTPPQEEKESEIASPLPVWALRGLGDAYPQWRGQIFLPQSIDSNAHRLWKPHRNAQK